jgi:hypothetical protein
MKIAGIIFLALCAAIVPAASSSPQDSPQTDNSTHKKSAKVRKITGCVGRGATDRDFTLDTANGSSWKINSDAVDIAAHVGHTVAVTGTVDHAKLHAAKEKGKSVKDADAPEHGSLTVTNIKMVSKSCSH